MRTFTKERRRELLTKLPRLVAKGLSAKECAYELGVSSDWCYRNMGPGAFTESAWKKESRRRHASLLAHLKNGGTPKEWGWQHGLSRNDVSKIVPRVGFRKYYLTADEYAMILRSRKLGVAA